MASAAPRAAAPMSQAVLARLLALLVPAGLLGGALGSQYLGGLHPCEMCYWQRWPHAAAIVLAAAAFVLQTRARSLTALAALAIAISGAIGVFHAGVELGWWEGLTQCTAGGALTLEELMNVPLVRCDQVQWSWLGISMAGWNAILSLGAAAAIAGLLARGRS
ncbi:MAG TPA: disulfide bond formation protein B [Sphingomicrobium sp.]|nr:disulfide bond formation protein B [Sphingomicrobium sp.]